MLIYLFLMLFVAQLQYCFDAALFLLSGREYLEWGKIAPLRCAQWQETPHASGCTAGLQSSHALAQLGPLSPLPLSLLHCGGLYLLPQIPFPFIKKVD